MHLVHSVAKYYFQTRISAIESFKKDPIGTQERVLRTLIDSAKDTTFGLEHGFADIKTYCDFKNHIPAQDYETLKPCFLRIQQGEKDVLWPGKVEWFAKSSGTTNDASKYIPVSKEGLHESHLKTGKDFLSLYLQNNPASNFFKGKGIVMGGSYQSDEQHKNIFVGDVSAILMRNIEAWIEHFREPSIAIALLADWEVKLDHMATATIPRSITNISGVPTWTLLLLKKVLEKTKKKYIKDVWSHLELYCHGGVGFAPYRQQFEDLIGKKIIYQNIYNASEGFFGFQDTLESDAMLLHLDNGVYYEFIPFDGTLQYADTVNIVGVKKGVDYALAISTNSGLWRYIIGDTIEFIDTAPHRIKIKGRTKHFINVFGEEVSIDNTDRALAATCLLTGAVMLDYTVAPVFLTTLGQGRHEWAIEFERQPKDLTAFERILDENLCKLNSDYQAKRTANLAMENLKVRIVPTGTFYRWLESKQKLGSQQKIPRLKNDRGFIDEILRTIVVEMK